MRARENHDDTDRAIRLYVYYHFAAFGRPPLASDTATALTMTPAAAEESYRRLAAGRLPKGGVFAGDGLAGRVLRMDRKLNLKGTNGHGPTGKAVAVCD